jgi:hypothetical protein
MRTPKDKREIGKALRQMQRISGGVLVVTHHTPRSIAVTMLTGGMRDRGFRVDQQVCEGIITRIMDGAAQPCALCDAMLTPFNLPARIVIMRPEIEAVMIEAERASELAMFCHVICGECERSVDVMKRVREYIATEFPGVRPITLSPGVGHG